jgi:surface polysaccharide O-acyltransferase-like enzyme
MGRIASIDTLRVPAILAVLILHSRLFRSGGDLASCEHAAAAVLDHAARFGVPFFFFVSGYLLAARRANGEPALGRAIGTVKRLAWLYVAWSVLLLAEEFGERAIREYISTGSASWPTLDGPDLVRRFVFGVRLHLWFLPALGVALLIVGFLERAGTRVLLGVGAGLYAVGLAGGSYAHVTGFDLGVMSRNGPFFGTLFVAAGFVAASSSWRPTLGQAIAVTAAGAAVHAAELLALHHFSGMPLVHERLNYLGGTALMGVGVGMIALARPGLGARTVWPKWGALSLGVYILHVDVQQALAAVNPVGGVAGQLVLVAAAYGISLAIAALLASTRAGRRLVC